MFNVDEEQRKRTLEELYLNNPEMTDEEIDQHTINAYAEALGAKLRLNSGKVREGGL